jgi:Uma2 family endonuclease
MAALPHLITVAEFRQLPKGGEHTYELHHGEVVAMTRPKARHWKLQLRLVDLLQARLRAFGVVGMEMPFRPVGEFELLAADVAAVSQARFDSVDPEDNLRGAPELVIEIKSRSNTAISLRERAVFCLANGAVQCWVLDQDRKSVAVIHADGMTKVYGIADAIPLAAFGSDALPVSEIFS